MRLTFTKALHQSIIFVISFIIFIIAFSSTDLFVPLICKFVCWLFHCFHAKNAIIHHSKWLIWALCNKKNSNFPKKSSSFRSVFFSIFKFSRYLCNKWSSIICNIQSVQVLVFSWIFSFEVHVSCTSLHITVVFLRSVAFPDFMMHFDFSGYSFCLLFWVSFFRTIRYTVSDAIDLNWSENNVVMHIFACEFPFTLYLLQNYRHQNANTIWYFCFDPNHNDDSKVIGMLQHFGFCNILMSSISEKKSQKGIEIADFVAIW